MACGVPQHDLPKRDDLLGRKAVGGNYASELADIQVDSVQKEEIRVFWDMNLHFQQIQTDPNINIFKLDGLHVTHHFIDPRHKVPGQNVAQPTTVGREHLERVLLIRNMVFLEKSSIGIVIN